MTVTTKVLSCNCVNEYQDKKYGKGRRVHNQGKRQQDYAYFKCTVCGNKVRQDLGKEAEKKVNKAKVR